MDELLSLISVGDTTAAAIFKAATDIVATTVTPGMGPSYQPMELHSRDTVAHNDVSPT